LKNYNKFSRSQVSEVETSGAIPYTNMHDFISTDFIYLEELCLLNLRAEATPCEVGFSFAALNSLLSGGSEVASSGELDSEVIQIVHDSLVLQLTLVKLVSKGLGELVHRFGLDASKTFELLDGGSGISLDSLKKFLLETDNVLLKEKEFSHFLTFLGMNGAPSNLIQTKEFAEIFKLQPRHAICLSD